MKKLVFLGFILSMVFVSCVTNRGSVRPPQSETPGIEIVFDSNELEVINFLLSKQNEVGKVLLINLRLTLDSYTTESTLNQARNTGLFLTSKYSEIDKILLDDFIEKNSIKMTIKRSTVFSVDFEWFDDIKEQMGVTSGVSSYWSKLREVSPNFGAIVHLSRIGFSTDKNIAIAYIEIIRGSMSGSGDFLVLERINGQWIIKKVINRWLS